MRRIAWTPGRLWHPPEGEWWPFAMLVGAGDRKANALELEAQMAREKAQGRRRPRRFLVLQSLALHAEADRLGSKAWEGAPVTDGQMRMVP